MDKIIYYVHKRITDDGDFQPRIMVKDKIQRKAVRQLTHKYYLTGDSIQALTNMGFQVLQYSPRRF